MKDKQQWMKEQEQQYNSTYSPSVHQEVIAFNIEGK